MIKQDFIESEIIGSDAYILTEFEMLVVEMSKKVDKELLETAFKRGLGLQEKNKNLEDLNAEQLVKELAKALKELAYTLSANLDVDYDD